MFILINELNAVLETVEMKCHTKIATESQTNITPSAGWTTKGGKSRVHYQTKPSFLLEEPPPLRVCLVASVAHVWKLGSSHIVSSDTT